MKHRAYKWFAVLCAALLLAGCQSVQTLPVAQRTPSQCGDIKLYGTDNVPFEYEELGVIGIYVTYKSMEEALQVFMAEAQKMRADAVLNLRVQPGIGVGGFFLVITLPNKIYITGTAVKIKRP